MSYRVSTRSAASAHPIQGRSVTIVTLAGAILAVVCPLLTEGPIPAPIYDSATIGITRDVVGVDRAEAEQVLTTCEAAGYFPNPGYAQSLGHASELGSSNDGVRPVAEPLGLGRRSRPMLLAHRH